MGLFRKNKDVGGAVSTQIRSGEQQSFGLLNSYVPLGGGDIALYRAIREAIPVLDAALLKIVRLVGGFHIVCSKPSLEKSLNRFLKTVDVGRGQQGFDTFLASFLSSMLTCGRGIGEIVTLGNREIRAILCGDVADVQIKEGTSPLDFKFYSRSPSGDFRLIKYQELILFTPFNPEPDVPYGASLFRSMPFMAEVLMKIYKSIGINWDRAGNVRFSVVYKPQGDMLDKNYARERSEEIAREWSLAMQSGKNGSVRDFVSVGDVDIKAIGADSPILDSEVPVRQILEQLISRTGIPPFMLGLNWSSTERMSAQQADLMTSELTAIRRSIEPVINKVCSLFLAMQGSDEDFQIEWEPINLQDAVEEAKVFLYEAQKEQIINQINSSVEA